KDGTRLPLQVADRAMLEVDRALRATGYPGFETQMLVLLSGRIRVGTLQAAIARVSEQYPAMASRLVEGSDGGPHWQFRPGACPVREVDLESADQNSVLEQAGRILSTPRNLGEEGPVQFHLLHRPDGRDVFLVQYNHTLMDNNATPSLLKEIDRFSRGPAQGA